MFGLKDPAVHRLHVTKRTETFEVPRPAGGEMLRIDPATALFARFDLGHEPADLMARAVVDPNVSNRADAIEALGAIVRDEKKPSAERDAAFGGLVSARAGCDFAPLRAMWIGQVASRKDDAAAAVVIEALESDRDLRVRLAAADALHGFEQNEKARTALAAHLTDGNDLIRTSVVAGAAKLKYANAFDVLVQQTEFPSWQSVVRVAALRGLGDLGDERALPTLVRFAAPGDNWSRGAAIESLGKLGKKKPRFRDAVLPYLDDPERGLRGAAAGALGAIADPDTIPILVRHFHAEHWPAVKDALRGAIKACRATAVEEGRLVSVESVRASQIRDRHAALRDEIAAFEPTVKGLAGEKKTEAETKLKSLKDQMAQAKRDLDELGVPEKPKPK
jgi:HEAT repeat protein